MKTFLKTAIVCLFLFNYTFTQSISNMNSGFNDTAPSGQFDQYMQLLTGIFGNSTLGLLRPHNGTDSSPPPDQQGLCGVSVNTTSLKDIYSPKSLSDCTNDKQSTIGSCCQININTTDVNINVCGVLTESNVKSLNNDQNKVLFTAFGIQTAFNCSAVKLVSSVLTLLSFILII